MAEVNLKNVKGERSNQESKEDWSHSSKKEQRVIKRDSSPKRANLTRSERQENDVAHLLLPNLALSGVIEVVCWVVSHRPREKDCLF